MNVDVKDWVSQQEDEQQLAKKQRIEQGYCDVDVWNMLDWFCKVIPDMLDKMANDGKAYPGTQPFDTQQKWHDWLYKTANKIRKSYELDNIHFDFNDGDWRKQRQKNFKKSRKLIKEAMTELGKHFFNLWD